jgi:hypothetical protein
MILPGFGETTENGTEPVDSGRIGTGKTDPHSP